MNAIFGLPYVVSSNPINLSMHILYTWNALVTMRIDKVEWILLTTVASRKWNSFTSTLSWKGKIWGPRHCLTKCALEIKLLIQNCWSFFSEKLLHTLIYCILIILEVCRSVLWATLYTKQNEFDDVTRSDWFMPVIIIGALTMLTNSLFGIVSVMPNRFIAERPKDAYIGPTRQHIQYINLSLLLTQLMRL